jgi:hypothetical protein
MDRIRDLDYTGVIPPRRRGKKPAERVPFRDAYRGQLISIEVEEWACRVLEAGVRGLEAGIGPVELHVRGGTDPEACQKPNHGQN